MAHDPSYDVYLPVLMILLEAKDEWTFWHALHGVRVLGKMQMTPGSVTCDFEAALIRGVRDQFSEMRKQAIRRKLTDLRFPTNQIHETILREFWTFCR
jgi:hypothetical protein